MSDARKRGFTLLEVLVGAALTLLLFGLVWQFLVPMMQSFMRNSARSDMERQAVVTMSRLVADMQLTPVAGLTLRTSGDPNRNVGLVMVPLTSITASGTALYRTSATVYSFCPGTGILRRTVQDIPPSYKPLPTGFNWPPTLLPADVTTMLNTANSSVDPLASGVTLFEILQPGARDDLIQPPVTFHLILERSGSYSPAPQQFEMRRSISFRNNGTPTTTSTP